MEEPFKNEELFMDNKNSNNKLNLTENENRKNKIYNIIFIILISIIFPIIELVILIITIKEEKKEEKRKGGLLAGIGTILYIIVCLINELISIVIGVICYCLKDNEYISFIFLCPFVFKLFFALVYLIRLFTDLNDIIYLFYINMIFYIIYFLLCLIFLILCLKKIIK